MLFIMLSKNSAIVVIDLDIKEVIAIEFIIIVFLFHLFRILQLSKNIH